MLQLNFTPAEARDLILIKLRMVVYDTPAARLMFAVWGWALADAYRTPPIALDDPLAQSKHQLIEDARRFIRSGPACLEFAGVNPGYAERVIRAIEAGLPVERRVFPCTGP